MFNNNYCKLFNIITDGRKTRCSSSRIEAMSALYRKKPIHVLDYFIRNQLVWNGLEHGWVLDKAPFQNFDDRNAWNLKQPAVFPCAIKISCQSLKINIVIIVHVNHGADVVQIVLMTILNLPTTDFRVLLTMSGVCENFGSTMRCKRTRYTTYANALKPNVI